MKLYRYEIFEDGYYSHSSVETYATKRIARVWAEKETIYLTENQLDMYDEAEYTFEIVEEDK